MNEILSTTTDKLNKKKLKRFHQQKKKNHLSFMPPGDKTPQAAEQQQQNNNNNTTKNQAQTNKRKKDTDVARDQPSLIQKGEVLQNLFEIEEPCGGGGFGQIYKVNHREFRQRMAMKIEPAKGDVRRAKLEMTVMLMLRGKSHIPILYGCGKIRGCPYIVMQMLGRNLSDLRRRQPERCLSGSSVFRVSIHVIIALRHLHEMGYVHRDIKPSNCCMGIGINRRKAHLIDFGMVRRIRDMEGKLRPERRYAPFRGTVRYVSVRMHQRKDVGFGDDLIGWFYAMIELLNGGLPWSCLEKTADILKSKTETPIKDLCDSHPKGLLKFAQTVINLTYEQRPKYDSLQKTLRSCLAPEVTDTTPYDWEVNTQMVSKRVMERSIMASVGTELPPPIDYPAAKRNRTPSRPRTKKVATASPMSKKAQTPPKKLSAPVDQQHTVDVDEHLAKIPIVKTKSLVKISDKSTKPSSKSKSQSKEKIKEKKPNEPKKVISSPITTTPDDVESTQLSE